jgi:uncharacterized membrane protein YbhN (UPF0104 family)
MHFPISKERWRRIRPWVSAAFVLLIAGAITFAARHIDWPQVGQALRRIPPGRLLLAALFSSLSYAGYACVDLFAYAQLGDRVSRPRSMAIAFVSYAFNQNFGSLLGSIGFRFRLYSHYDVKPAAIARVVGLSFLTNWSGYFVLAGIAFSSRSLQLPSQWDLGATGLQLIGAALLLLVTSYLGLCAFSPKRTWRVAGADIELPHWSRALVQVGLSCLIWLAIAATLYTLLRGHAGPLTILTVFLLASIAGLITHVPGGLGVIEAVFLALLGGQYARHELLAALIVYRVVYYLWPLLPAAALYAWLEASSPEADARRASGGIRESGVGNR